MRGIIALLAAAILLAVAGCQTAPREQFADLNILPGTNSAPGGGMTAVTLTNRLEASLLQPSTEFFTLGPGDRVEIELLGETNSQSMTVVAPDGKLYFSLLPGIDVWGLTLSQAKEKMEGELARFMREKPQLSLILRGIESKRIWIMGRVQAPGVYAMTNQMTLLEAISMAGGTLSLSNYRDQEAAGISEELADLSRSFVIREGRRMPVDFARLVREGDMMQNVYLQADDFIYLPAATSRDVYVLGAVVQPRPVPYQEGLTVAGAVASAYGTLKGAYLTHVAVVRGSLQNPQLAVVDYKHAIRGKANDMELQPGDIVYVPWSPYRYLYRYAELIVNTFVSSAAINAGTRLAADNRPTGVGGVFIPVGSGIQVIPPASPPPIR